MPKTPDAQRLLQVEEVRMSYGADGKGPLVLDGVDVAILCMSGDSVATRVYREAGFDGVLDKPIDYSTLRACLTRYAGWSHARSAPGVDGRSPAAAGA